MGAGRSGGERSRRLPARAARGCLPRRRLLGCDRTQLTRRHVQGDVRRDGGRIVRGTVLLPGSGLYQLLLKNPNVRKEAQLEITNSQKIHKEILEIELNISQKYIDNLLSDEVKAAVQDGKLFYIFREDLFMRNQMVIILIGKNEETLKNNLTAYKDEIYEEMNEYHFKRLNTIIFQKAEQKRRYIIMYKMKS